jgi:hypothetical protein
MATPDTEPVESGPKTTPCNVKYLLFAPWAWGLVENTIEVTVVCPSAAATQEEVGTNYIDDSATTTDAAALPRVHFAYLQ